MAAIVADKTLPLRVQAFLMTIQWSEGTARYMNPYQVLFGGGQFQSYAAHPNILVKKGGYSSTAAGAYQILKRTADGLYMPDFTPQAQDKAAVQLIRRRGGYDALVAGDIETAINKCRLEWASFPKAGYGQPEKGMAAMLAAYNGYYAQVGGDSSTTTSGGTEDKKTEWKRKAIVVAAIVVVTALFLIIKK